MKRLVPLLLAAAALCGAAPGRSGQPEPRPTAGDGAPPGYTIRPIGAGTATIKLSGANRIFLRGDGSLRQGRGGSVNGIQLESCRDILVTDIQLSGWYCGVRANACSSIEFRNVLATKNRQQGWLLNNCSGAVLKGCEGSKTGGTSKSQHGFYAGNWQGGKTADIVVEDSIFYGSKLAEFQVNSESASAAAKGIVLRRCKITNDTFSCNFLGAGVTLDGCQVTSKKKALTAAQPYGRNWPSVVALKTATTITGSVQCKPPNKVVKQ